MFVNELAALDAELAHCKRAGYLEGAALALDRGHFAFRLAYHGLCYSPRWR